MAWQDRGELKLPQQNKKQTKNFWQDNISTAGGIGGSLGGAALGASIGSIVPGIGTVIGGLVGGVAGGALGGGLGQGVENAVTGEEDLWKDVGREAALSGVFSAPPIRAGKAILGAGKALATGAGGQAAKTAAETALTKPGVLSTVGASLRGGARGVETGVRSGGSRLTPSKAKEVNSFIENVVKAKGLTAAKQADSVEKFITSQNDLLSNAVRSSNRTLTNTEKKAIVEKLKKSSSEIIGIDPEQSLIIDDLVTRVNQSPDVKSLDDVRKFIDSGINYARNNASATPTREQALRAARRVFTDEVASRAPGVKGIKTNLSKALDAQDLLLQKSTGGFGQAQTSIGTIPIPRQIGQAAQSAGGKAIGLADAINPLSPTASAGRIGTVGALVNTGEPTEGEVFNQDQLSFDANTPMMSNPMMSNTTNMGQSYNTGQDLSMQQGFQQSPYPRENLMYDIQRDPSNADKYIAYYQQLQEVFAPASTGGELTQTGITALAGLDTSLQNLDEVQNVLQQNQGAFDPIRGRLTSLNPYDPTASSINQATLIAAQNIGRALEGGKLTDADIARYQAALPNITDTPQQAQAKIDRLRQLIQGQRQNYLNLQQNYGGADVSGADLAQYLQGAY